MWLDDWMTDILYIYIHLKKIDEISLRLYRECLYAALESISEMNIRMHEVWGFTAQCEVLQPLTGHCQ